MRHTVRLLPLLLARCWPAIRAMEGLRRGQAGALHAILLPYPLTV